jgi:large repetitive protein
VCCDTRFTLLRPDGRTLASTSVGTFGGFLDATTLPSTGTYTILVDPQGAATGSMTLTLYDVPPDVTGTLVIGGAAMTATITTPGQNVRLTFDGRAGQRVSLRLSSVTILASYVSVLRPDGTRIGSQSHVTTSGRTITVDLPGDGLYTIVVDPQVAATGSMTLTLSQAV